MFLDSKAVFPLSHLVNGKIHACGNNDRFQFATVNYSQINPSVPSYLQHLSKFNITKLAIGVLSAAVTSCDNLLIWGLKSALFADDSQKYLQYRL